MTQPTIMRIRGEIVATLGIPEPGGDISALAAIGIGLLDAQLLAQVSEDPWTHSYGNDWMWHQLIYLTASAQADDGRRGTLAAARYVLDVRSKRRADPSDILVAHVVNPATSAPATLGVALTGRVLLQES